MRSDRLAALLTAAGYVPLCLVQNGVVNASEAQQAPAILSRRVPSFSVEGLCRVDALLVLGQQEQLPLGIEYVDRDALEQPLTRHFQEATLGEIIRAILGGRDGYSWQVRDGVLDVTHKLEASGKRNLFDYVIPEFAIGRCSLADASNLLYLELDRQLHPQTTGYAGDYNPGSCQEMIGPFELRNMSVRQILSRLVSASNRAAWIVRVQPGGLDYLPRGGLWTIIEYEDPPRHAAQWLLREIF